MATELFKVEIRNRIVKGAFNIKPIKGKQGSWYSEPLYCLADSEKEAEGYALKEIESRRMFGISRRRKRNTNVRREIEVLDVRRIT